MKKLLLVVAVILIVLIALTSCAQLHCATYSTHNKKTHAQAKYAKQSKRSTPIFASNK